MRKKGLKRSIRGIITLSNPETGAIPSANLVADKAARKSGTGETDEGATKLAVSHGTETRREETEAGRWGTTEEDRTDMSGGEDGREGPSLTLSKKRNEKWIVGMRDIITKNLS